MEPVQFRAGVSCGLAGPPTVAARCVASVALWIVSIAARNCNAEQLSVDLDPAKTQIAFTISDTLHTVNGRFRLNEGPFLFRHWF